MSKITRMVLDAAENKTTLLYHYSSKPHSRLLTNALQGIATKWGEYGNGYDDHISFFMEPIPDSIAESLGDKFTKWNRGDVLYEHIVNLEDIKIFKWELASTPEGRRFYLNNFDAKRREERGYLDNYLRLKEKFKKDNLLVGEDPEQLSKKIPEYVSADNMKSYIEINKKHGKAEQYASEIPHLMIYTRAPVRVTSRNKIKLK